MADVTASFILRCTPEYSENKFPSAATFDDDGVSITKESGDAGATIAYTTEQIFDGAKAVKIRNTSIPVPVVFNFGTALETTIQKTGQYIISVKLMHNFNPTNYTPPELKIYISTDGVESDTLNCVWPDNDGFDALPANSWFTAYGRFVFNAGEVLDFRFEQTSHPFNLSSISVLYMDAMQLDLDDRLLVLPSVYTPPA